MLPWGRGPGVQQPATEGRIQGVHCACHRGRGPWQTVEAETAGGMAFRALYPLLLLRPLVPTVSSSKTRSWGWSPE